MNCNYCGNELEKGHKCDIDDLKTNIEALGEYIEDQAGIICHQLEQLDELNTTH